MEAYEVAFPFACLIALVLIILIVLVNGHGRRLTRHEDWLGALGQRVANLHKERAQNYVRSLQVTRRTPPPPPPGTIEVTPDMIISGDTERIGSPESGIAQKKKEPP
jgi:hypothetical protein